jgi:hypothetical protein
MTCLLIFVLGPQKKLFCQQFFRGVFFFLRRKAVFRKVEAEAESVFDKSYTKGALTTNGGSFNDF